MNFVFLLFLTAAQLLIGFNLLSKLNISLNKLQVISLSIITGMGITSLIPLILQLVFIPLTTTVIFSCISIVTIISTISARKKLAQLSLKGHSIQLYEWPWIAIMGAMVYLAVINALYVPTTARDLLCGPEPIAHFALTEHTFINSVFEQDMPMNNGPFKSLYIPALQLIYKQIGFTFGKIWVVILSTSFLIFLYSTVRALIHPVIAGALAVFFLFIPELYAYTYLVLYDYSNMVFFFLSLYFLKEHLHNEHKRAMILSALFMALAVYIRPETLIITALITIYGIGFFILSKKKAFAAFIPLLIFAMVAVATYLVTSNIYLNYYLPVHYDVGEEINQNLTDITPIFDRLNGMTFELIFSRWGLSHYGYFFITFFTLLAAEMFIYRKLSKEGAYWLSLFLIVFLGIAIIGYVLPLADLIHSTKRALFKVMPIVVLCLAHNKVVLGLSEKITNYSTQPASSKKRKKHKKQHAPS